MIAFQDIQTAADRIQPYIHRTPVLTSENIDRVTGTTIFFKCENFQKVGAFKFRGAFSAIFSLSESDARSGVATHSSGNHAQAVALAAHIRGIPAYIVMPENAPHIKQEAVRGYGANITFCPPTLQDREAALEQVVSETDATFIHPYNDLRVIAGQGTAALELLSDYPDLDAFLAPVGGGGLLSGSAVSVNALTKNTNIFGAEPQEADDAYRSFRAGHIIPSTNPQTIADGLLTSLGDHTFTIIQKYVDDILTVTEESIISAMRLVWERMKIIIEPSAAVPLAAILNNRDLFRSKKIGVILSGGNVDLNMLPWQTWK